MQSKGGSEEECLDQKVSILNHFSNEVESLVKGKDIFLDKLSNYGICRKCGKQIPLERLKEVPQTGACCSCKKNRERR